MQTARNTTNDDAVVRPALIHARAIPPLSHGEAKLRTTSIVYHLSGNIGGMWQLGAKVPPAATIQLDVLDFNLLASGRLAIEEAWSRASIEGDRVLAHEVLNHTNIPY